MLPRAPNAHSKGVNNVDGVRVHVDLLIIKCIRYGKYIQIYLIYIPIRIHVKCTVFIVYQTEIDFFEGLYI